VRRTLRCGDTVLRLQAAVALFAQETLHLWNYWHRIMELPTSSVTCLSGRRGREERGIRERVREGQKEKG
jgi:hypothetical protein